MNRLILSVAAFAAAGTASAADIKELAGSYKVVSMKQSGTDAPKEEVAKVKSVAIEGDKFTIELVDDKGGVEKKVATLKVDDKAKPATLDLSPTEGAEKGKAFPGIFTYEKGKLTIALAEKGDRPKDFKGDKDQMVVVLEKEKK